MAQTGQDPLPVNTRGRTGEKRENTRAGEDNEKSVGEGAYIKIMEGKHSLRFGPFVLDAERGDLSKNGVAVKIQPQPVKLLVLLATRPGELVTREEIGRQLWPDTEVVYDQSLNVAIRQLRTALRDRAEAPAYIETVPRRGYRFIATPLPITEPNGNRRLLAAALLLMALGIAITLFLLPPATEKTAPGRRPLLMVLPFENFSTEQEADFFSDGLTEEVIAELARLDPRQLGVVARTSSMRFKGGEIPLARIAEELGIDYFLEGSVRFSEGGMHVTVQLIRNEDQSHLWAQQYDRDRGDWLAMQRDVAERVAGVLALELLPGGPAAFAARVNPDPAAVEACYKGRYLLKKRASDRQAYRDQVVEALASFRLSIELAPEYAPGYLGLSAAILANGDYDRFPEAKQALHRAIGLDPNSAEAYRRLGNYLLYQDWQWEEARVAWERAISLAPGAAENYQDYAYYFLVAGRPDEAIAQARRALELDPVSTIAHGDLSWLYFRARRYEQAIDQAGKTLDLDPENRNAIRCLIHTYTKLGQDDQAAEQVRRYLSLLKIPEETIPQDPAEALAAFRSWRLERTRARAEKEKVHPAAFALLYADLGHADQSMSALVAASEERYCPFLPFIESDPRLDLVREDPRYETLVKKIGLPAAP